jgi:hypothetical protein
MWFKAITLTLGAISNAHFKAKRDVKVIRDIVELVEMDSKRIPRSLLRGLVSELQ